MISSLRSRETHAQGHFEASVCRRRYDRIRSMQIPTSHPPDDAEQSHSHYACRRTRKLEISRSSAIPSVHEGGLTCLCLELTENRYLLGAATDSSFAIYDTAIASTANEAQCCLCKVDRTKREGHKYSVTCTAWYPVDSGLFVTGSNDRDIKVCQLLQRCKAH